LRERAGGAEEPGWRDEGRKERSGFHELSPWERRSERTPYRCAQEPKATGVEGAEVKF
jgi:hypothetical protein